jgi:hypothetical protein
MSLFVVPLRNLTGGTERNRDNLSQGNLCPSQDFNQAPPEYKAEEWPLFSGVGLSPVGTAATSGLLYKPQMIDEGDCGAIGE